MTPEQGTEKKASIIIAMGSSVLVLMAVLLIWYSRSLVDLNRPWSNEQASGHGRAGDPFRLDLNCAEFVLRHSEAPYS